MAAAAQDNLKLIFEGQTVNNDFVRNNRLKKKIQYVSMQLHNMAKRESVSTVPNLEGTLAPIVKGLNAGTNLIMKNFNNIISRFEERDPVFNSISRAHIDHIAKNNRETPPIGTYNLQSENFRSTVRSHTAQGTHKTRREMMASKLDSEMVLSPVLELLPGLNDSITKKSSVINSALAIHGILQT